nr:Phosphoglucomutase-3 [Polyrhizophydium stewartii]
MITASHNPEHDNGVKLVEPLGEMLAQAWETYAMDLANAATPDALVAALNKIIAAENIDLAQHAAVVVARDTRPSGPALVASLVDGVKALAGVITDFGVMTTPQLHYVTRCINTKGTPDAYGEPTAAGYYKKLADAYLKIAKGRKPLSALHVDAANGVGAPALRELAATIGDQHLGVVIANDDIATRGKLNHNCGADFVKISQKAPEGIDLKPGQRWCSLDGDADRIVFYYADASGKFKLLDGDKIATLAAGYIMSLIREAKATHADGTPLKVGLVQTAYANGSSTAYVRDTLKVPVVFTPTGVKHLHHEAEHFDVGVYFEANGHGTVLFSKAAVKAFEATAGKSESERAALEALRTLSDLINQTVGDALSDMLMVEVVLLGTQQTLEAWDAGYTDLPSRQEKVKVQNRALFVPIKADTELAEPAGLQDKINEQVAKFRKGRCFVRPSGTEDIVRVYAEAETVQETEDLAYTVCGIVFDGYGGVGERPAKFKRVAA